MKRLQMLFFIISVGFAVAVHAQPTIGLDDIPTDPGTIAHYNASSGNVPVSTGAAGADRFWNFTGEGDTLQQEVLYAPADSPVPDMFPTANRVAFGAVPFGGAGANAWRYENVAADSWDLLGLYLGVDSLAVPVPLGQGMTLMPLPLNYGDSWDIAVNTEVVLASADIPSPEPIPFDSVQLNVNISGSNEADAWGTAVFDGGTAQVLRIYTSIGGTIDGYGVTYLFGQRILIPLGELYAIDIPHSYFWYAPGLGEVAFMASQPDETNPNFTSASAVRRRALLDNPMVSLTATPQNTPIEIPAQGGAFTWDVNIQTAIPTQVSVEAWTRVVIPNGASVQVERVPLTLPANADWTITGLTQTVPAFAPAGSYTYYANLGIFPAVAVARDSFEFTKLATGAIAGKTLKSDAWTLVGLDGAHDNSDMRISENDSAALPDEFALAPVHPNPFNASATFSVSLPEAARLDVRLYDVLGREVTNLVQSEVIPAGAHVFNISGERFASGLYFIVAIADGYGERTQKAVIVR